MTVRFAHIVALVALFAAPAYAPPDPPKTRADLSPLARTINDSLFGNPYTLPFDVAHPFFEANLWHRVTLDQYRAAFSELMEYRGAELDSLRERGRNERSRVREQTVQDGTRLIRDPSNPWDRIGASWDVLRARKAAGEAPLPDEEVERRALARTKVLVPEAFEGEDAMGLSDTGARQTYRRNSVRIALTETQPKNTALTAAEFEAWKVAERRKLAKQHQENQLQLLEIAIRRNPSTVLDESGRSLSFEELKKIPLLDPYAVETNMGKPYIFMRTSLQPVDPAYRRLVVPSLSGGGISNPLYQTTKYLHPPGFSGSIDRKLLADLYANEVLTRKNEEISEAWRQLTTFQFSDYEKDQGKKFWTAWRDKSQRSVVAQLLLSREPDALRFGQWNSENSSVTSPFELALWGKIATDPNYYDTVAAQWKPHPTALSRFLPGFQLAKGIDPQNLRTDKPTEEAKQKERRGTALRGAARVLLPAGIAAVAVGLATVAARPDLFHNATRPDPTNISGNGGTAAATNKPQGDSGVVLFEIVPQKPGAGIATPKRFALGDPSKATTEITVPSLKSPVAQYTVVSKQSASGTTRVPTADGAQLFSLRLTSKESGSALVPGTHYDVRRTPLGEYVIFPKRGTGPFSIEGDFGGYVDLRPQTPTAPELRNLDHAELLSIASDLEGDSFVLLPSLLRRAVSVSHDTGAPLSIYDFEKLLDAGALYSGFPEKSQWFPIFRSEINRASRFLNPEGVSCLECDGAQELGVALSKRLLRKQKDFVVSPRSVLVPTHNPLQLTDDGRHADFVIARTDGSGRMVFDTTPTKIDPRTPGVSPAAPPPASRGSIDMVKLARELPASPRPLGSAPQDRSPFPWNDVMAQLIYDWNRAERARYYRAPVQLAAVAMGPLDPTASRFEPAPSVAEALILTTFASPDADALEAHWQDLKRRLVEAKAKTAGSRLPPIVLRDVNKIVQLYLRGEIDFLAMQQRLRTYLPTEFRWAGEMPEEQLRAAIGAIQQRQLDFYSVLRDKHRLAADKVAQEIAKASPWVLDGEVETATRAGFELLAKTPMRSPGESVAVVPAFGGTCAGTVAGLNR